MLGQLTKGRLTPAGTAAATSGFQSSNGSFTGENQNQLLKVEETKPVQFPPNPKTLLIDDRYERIMSNLRASVFSTISPSGNIAPQLQTHIEKRLREFFPSFRTASHPPYASMIQRAISELNDEEGSTQEAISAFIKREYEHLPWGHESFLSHHLGKLCGNMEIACVNGGRYMLLVEDCEFKEMTGSSKKKQGRRGRVGRKKARVKNKRKQSQAEKQQIEVFKEDTLQAMELKQNHNQMTTLERDVQMGFNKQEEAQAITTQNLDCDYPVVEEENQLQITSPYQQKELICNLLSEQHPQTKNLSNQQMVVQLQPAESSFFHEWHRDAEQHLDLPRMERSPKQRAPVNKDTQYQDEQQPSKHRGRGRPRERNSDTDMIRESLLPSGDHDCNEQQQKLEGPGNVWFNKQEEAQAITTQNLDCDYPVVEEENRLQITSPYQQKELICNLLSEQHPQTKNLSNQQMVVQLQPAESSFFHEWRRDAEQHLDLPRMERSPKQRAPVNKDTQYQDEQQPSKHRGRGRPRERNSDTDMIRESLLPSGDHDCNEQQQKLEGPGNVWFNKQEEAQAITTQNLDCDYPVVEEENQLQITSPYQQKELICNLLSEQHPQTKNLSNQQMVVQLQPAESSFFHEWHRDAEQHLDLPSMEGFPKQRAPVNKDTLYQDEQQPSKHQGRGRPRERNSDTDMIRESLLPSGDHDCNEQQQQLEGPGNVWFPVPKSNFLLDATTSSHSHDKDHNKQQQPQSKRRGRPPKRNRNQY